LNNRAALVFFWKELERQVRIEGIIEKVSDRRKRGIFSQPPARQPDRRLVFSAKQSNSFQGLLEKNVAENSSRFGENEVERPPFWGGYILVPALVEFWQGRSNRLHDRIEYIHENGSWIKRRLAP
jgi:pyridoxamine 5'-phosphate oxidase